jgi:FkbM family methyltransferase
MLRKMQRKLKHIVAMALIPCARRGMRLVPRLQRPIWHRLIWRRLHWRDYRFVAGSHFGVSFAGTTADNIQRYIYYFGRWEPHVEATIRECLRPGDTFIDIGANIGYFTLLAWKLIGPTGRVISIEASAPTFQLLLGNIERNGAQHVVRAIHAAVTDREGIVKLYTPEKSNIGMASLVRSMGQGYEEVRSAPLRALLTKHEIESARLVKIDVEGAESLVLQGMLPILAQMTSCNFLIEINADFSSSDMLTELTRRGWRPYGISPVDSLENYFEPPLKSQLVPLTCWTSGAVGRLVSPL